MADRVFPLQPSPVHVPDPVLVDLRDRITRTRWPAGMGYDDPRYGVSRSYLQELAEYWADGFDWRSAEKDINRYEHYTELIDGVPVHFMRCPGVGPAPKPLILTHGWPWTFWHFSRVADALADPAAHGGDASEAFDVLIPSLPGFGFSAPLDERSDLNFWKIADLWHTLMTGTLGYDRYAAAGCDVGALVTGQLGHKYADELYGIHIGSGLPLDFFTGDRAWDVSGGRPLPDPLSGPAREQLLAWERRFAVHLAAQVLAPSTLAYGLNDSPVGMLAWILERWDKWSEHAGDLETVFSKDELLTHATIYWAAGTIGSSLRIYANNNRYPWAPSHDRIPAVEAPTGITFVGYENPPGVTTPAERVAGYLATDRAGWYNLINVTAHARGGHFIPWEAPHDWVTDLRRTFRLI